MLPFPTFTMRGEVETKTTIDLDKVFAYFDGGAAGTHVISDTGIEMTITEPYEDLMKWLIENGAD